jgi:hypothetical protein
MDGWRNSWHILHPDLHFQSNVLLIVWLEGFIQLNIFMDMNLVRTEWECFEISNVRWFFGQWLQKSFGIVSENLVGWKKWATSTYVRVILSSSPGSVCTFVPCWTHEKQIDQSSQTCLHPIGFEERTQIWWSKSDFARSFFSTIDDSFFSKLEKYVNSYGFYYSSKYCGFSPNIVHKPIPSLHLLLDRSLDTRCDNLPCFLNFAWKSQFL